MIRKGLGRKRPCLNLKSDPCICTRAAEKKNTKYCSQAAGFLHTVSCKYAKNILVLCCSILLPYNSIGLSLAICEHSLSSANITTSELNSNPVDGEHKILILIQTSFLTKFKLFNFCFLI
jgi:hypothetical protein